jgi:hypothetical protein
MTKCCMHDLPSDVGAPVAAVVSACALPADLWRAAGLAAVHASLDLDLDSAYARSPGCAARLLEHLDQRLTAALPPLHTDLPPT